MKSILIALFSVVFIFGCSNSPDSVTLKSGLKYNEGRLRTPSFYAVNINHLGGYQNMFEQMARLGCSAKEVTPAEAGFGAMVDSGGEKTVVFYKVEGLNPYAREAMDAYHGNKSSDQLVQANQHQRVMDLLSQAAKWRDEHQKM